MTTTKTLICALVATLLVSACSRERAADRVLFDGNYFRAKAKSVNKKVTPTKFTVVVSGVSASLDGAREAGRFEGTKYCVQNFGSSRIDWGVGPDAEPETLRVDNDKLTFDGTCLRP